MITYKKALVLAVFCAVLMSGFTSSVRADDAPDATNTSVLVNKAHAQIDADTAYTRGKAYYSLAKVSTKPALAKQDYEQALKCFRIAADRGKIEALLMIAVIYSEGDGVRQDDAEATKWYIKAADQSNAEARKNLRAMYDNGRGIMQDYMSAYLRYNLTASAGNQ